MSTKDIARKVAIVGIGSSDYHTLYKNPDPTRTREEMAIDVMRQALDDCGLKRSDIDGLVTGGTSGYEDFGYRSGLTDVRYLADYPVAGRMCASALFSAAMAVHNGVSDYCFLFNSVAFKSLAMKFDMAGQYGGDAASTGPLYNEVYGMASPGAREKKAATVSASCLGGRPERRLASCSAARSAGARLARLAATAAGLAAAAGVAAEEEEEEEEEAAADGEAAGFGALSMDCGGS